MWNPTFMYRTTVSFPPETIMSLAQELSLYFKNIWDSMNFYTASWITNFYLMVQIHLSYVVAVYIWTLYSPLSWKMFLPFFHRILGHAREDYVTMI